MVSENRIPVSETEDADINIYHEGLKNCFEIGSLTNIGLLRVTSCYLHYVCGNKDNQGNVQYNKNCTISTDCAIKVTHIEIDLIFPLLFGVTTVKLIGRVSHSSHRHHRKRLVSPFTLIPLPDAMTVITEVDLLIHYQK